MSVHIDRTFLLRLTPKLKRFTKKRDDLYNFRCPLCGDSHKNTTKSRGYIYRKSDAYFYICYNCGVSTTFGNFLERVEPAVYPEYVLERFRNNNVGFNSPEEIKPVIITKSAINLPTVASLMNEHVAKQYVLNRKIPEHHYSNLYYTHDFAMFVASMGIEKQLKPNEQRLIIPFHDGDGNLTGFQGRDLSGDIEHRMRYISIRLKANVPLVYGLLDIDVENRVYVVEGPFDSMFLDNAIAVAGSTLESALHYIPKENVVLVYDNEPRNKEIVKLIEDVVDNHFNIVIWPQMIEEKDINEMILSGLSKEDLEDILETNTFLNLSAKLALYNWKKI